MKNLTEFEKEICKKYNEYYPHALGDIEMTYQRLRSFDKTLLALQVASIFNISLMEMTEFFVNELFWDTGNDFSLSFWRNYYKYGHRRYCMGIN